jgi:hypothetical protein
MPPKSLCGVLIWRMRAMCLLLAASVKGGSPLVTEYSVRLFCCYMRSLAATAAADRNKEVQDTLRPLAADVGVDVEVLCMLTTGS